MAGYGKIVVLSSPEAVKDVFRGDPHVLHSGEGNEFLSASVGRTSVLVLDDEPHDRQRKVLLPAMKGERMRAFFTAMQRATLDELAAWPLNQSFAADESMRRITARVILQAIFGWDVDPRLAEMEQQVHRLMRETRSRWSLVMIKIFTPERVKPSAKIRYYKALWELNATIYAAIAAAREQPAAERNESVLTELLAARHADGSPLSDVEMRDAIVTILIAGHETTSVALAWAVEQIAARPDVLSEIQHELVRVAGAGELPNAEQIEQLGYLDAAVREVLRVRTILPFVVRLTKQPFVAGGHEYPPGVLLAPCSHLMHQRPDIYPEPQKFRPERFLERKFTGYEWFPFGGGNRICLGMAFALYELKVVLATLFAASRLTRAGPPAAYIRRGLTLAPRDGAQVTLVERLNVS